MRIIYHHRTLGDGAEGIHVKEMVAAFRALGHVVKVVGPVGETPKRTAENPSILEKIKTLVPGAVFEVLEILYNLFGLYLLLKTYIRFQPDFIYDRYITFNASSILFGRLVRRPVAVEVNAPLALERANEPDERLFFRRLANFCERWICANADRIFVVSTPLKDYMERLGVPEANISVLPNSVNQRFFSSGNGRKMETRDVLGIRQDTLVFGFAGVLRPWHGLELLLQAFERICTSLNDTHILIVGDGPVLPIIQQQAAALGLRDQISFTGRISHQDISYYINEFDVAVSPKATFYASPMKILEYMALSKIVIAPDMRNIRDIIVDGETGLLFEPENISDLTRKMSLAIRDEQLRLRIGRHARSEVRRNRTWERNAQQVIDRVFNLDGTNDNVQQLQPRLESNLINIMYVVHGFGIGGLEKCVVDLVNGIDRNRFEPSICCLTTSGASTERLTNKECSIFEMHKQPGNDLTLPIKLARLFRRKKTHVVHSANWGTFLESIAGAKLARVPVSIHMKQGMELEAFFDHRANGKKRKVLAQRMFAARFNRIVVVSHDIKNHFATVLRIPPDKIEVIPNCVDTDFFQPDATARHKKRQELGVCEDTVLIGSVGRLARVKNYASLIEALAIVATQNPRVELILVGDGPERANLEQQIDDLHLETKVTLLGECFDTPELLNAMDLFVLPSFSEGISISLLEAMSTGLPVIASNVGGNPELVAHGMTGLLYVSDDATELARHVLTCASDALLRKGLAVKARMMVEREFSMGVMLARYNNLYLTLLRNQTCRT